MLLLGYFVAISMVSYLGGKLSVTMTMTHMRIQVLMSLISGFIIGISIYHLLPHSLEYVSGPGALKEVAASMLMGVVVMVLLLRTFNVHQHEFEEGDADDSPPHSGVCVSSLFVIVLGLGLHSVMEGLALGASILAEQGKGAWGGAGVFLAIFLHKPLDAYSIIGMMRCHGYNQRICTWVNILFALLCPIVMVLTFCGAQQLIPLGGEALIGYTLAFSSGAFLCIALSDLLPEIQFHHHDRGKLTIVFLLGVCLSCILGSME